MITVVRIVDIVPGVRTRYLQNTNIVCYYYLHESLVVTSKVIYVSPEPVRIETGNVTTVKMSLCLMKRHQDDRSETEVRLPSFLTMALDGTEQRYGPLASTERKQLSGPFCRGYGRPML